MTIGFAVNAERELSVDEDHLVYTHIPQKLRDMDLGFYQTKWFDYRRMTPLEATIEYIRRYAEVYRVIYARNLDHVAAQHVKTISPVTLLLEVEKNDSKAKSRLSAFWRGRQVADAIGMPYATYIELAFTARLRAWKRPYLPQPQHLYAEMDVERVQERWQEMQLAILNMPTDPAYLVQNYQNMPYQNDFHEWCFIQANTRRDPAYILAKVIREDHLPVDKVQARIGKENYARVERELENPAF